MDFFKALANVSFLPVRRKYYAIGEVEAWLKRMRDAADRLRSQQQALEDQLSDYERQLYAREDEVAALQAQLEAASAAPNPQALVLKASDQAMEIVNSALQQSDQLLSTANEQRARSLAASRAAYYNALQFKQNLAQQYRQLEADLDVALDALCRLDNAAPILPSGSPEPASAETSSVS